jgi:hypothetical protein
LTEREHFDVIHSELLHQYILALSKEIIAISISGAVDSIILLCFSYKKICQYKRFTTGVLGQQYNNKRRKSELPSRAASFSNSFSLLPTFFTTMFASVDSCQPSHG